MTNFDYVIIKTKTKKMEEYYNQNDFQEFVEFFNEPNMSFFNQRNITLGDFVESLNYIVDEKECVCDFYILMQYLKKLNDCSFHRLRVIYGYYRHLSVYYYFKFLLLDENEKQLFLNNEFFNTIHVFHLIIKDSTLTELMQSVFKIADDTYLDNFFDYKDNYRNYQRLDTNKLDNIKSQGQYIEQPFMEKFLISVEKYFKIKFLYHLIYTISNENNYEPEANVSVADDFIYRFYNSEKFFLIMYHYLYQVLYQVSPLSRNIIKKEIRYTYELEDLLDKGLKLPDFNNLTQFDVKKIQYLLTEFFNTNIYSNERRLNEMMTIFIKYKSNKSLLDHLNHIEIHSKILSERYNEYYNSKLNKSLVNLNNIKEKLISYMSVNKIRNNNKYYDLFIYLKDILDKHYFY